MPEKRATPVWVMLVVYALTLPASAQEPTGDSPPAAAENRSGNGDTPDGIALEDSLLRYRDQIDSLADSGQLYDPAMEEALLGLGQAYLERGNPEQAAEVIDRAFQISRINNGIESEAQIRALDRLIGANMALGDWEALEKNHSYLYWLANRLYRDDAPLQLLDIMSRITTWHLEAFEQRRDPIPYRHLLYANDILQDAIALVEAEFGDRHIFLVNLLKSLNYTHYLTIEHIRAPDTYDEIFASSVFMNRSARLAGRQNGQRYLLGFSAQQRVRAMDKLARVYEANNTLTSVANESGK